MIDWKDCITLTFITGKYSKESVKIAVPRSLIKGLKQARTTDYTTKADVFTTLLLLDLKAISALNLHIEIHSSMRFEDFSHEFSIEEDYKIVLGLLQDSPAAKILHGETT